MPRNSLSAQDIEAIRTVLIDRKRLLTDRVERLSEDSVLGNPKEQGETSSIPTHQADLGSETFEQAEQEAA
jgi:hypothetical protein